MGHAVVIGTIPMLVGGLALVVLDFRTSAPDLLPDILGWVLIAVAARRLSLSGAAWLALVAGLASVADAWLPYRHVAFDPVTGEPVEGPNVDDGPVHLVYDDVSGWRLAAMSVGAVLTGLALVALIDGIAQLATASGRDGPARQFRIIGWLIIPLWTAPFLAVVAHAVIDESGRFDPVWNGGLVYVSLVGFALFATLVVLLVRERDEPWTQPLEHAEPSPWEERRLRRTGSPDQRSSP